MICKVENLSEEQLEKIRQLVGEAFVNNELFHNWGPIPQRREDVMKYMALYVDYVYEAGELYANEDFTGFIGLEDSGNAHKLPQIKMLLRMLIKIRFSRLKSLVSFAKQIGGSNEKYAKQRHIDALMVCVDKGYQGRGIASELVTFAKEMSDELGIPLLFDTDMKDYAEMYQHLGCELYNTVTADNGVTRYSLCYHK
ncbi:GNAT family N-acetyltransferase [Butyrivibrio sp. VCD2006]|uniref:GNAT family N-acetyltransferase n=1 Tax=Butyrivibrio sp. VCD2006 TaxID=1280664 RepID=UPI0004084488|nr:GNAT family N-acetyltransferase [Butyrivibrio sp. VCD2006]